MAGQPIYSTHVVNAVVNAVRGGMSRYAAAKKYGMKHLTVTKWCKAAGLEFGYIQVNTSLGFERTNVCIDIKSE